MSLAVTDRTKVRRKPARGSHELAVIEAVLDAGLVCHVAFTGPHGPIVIPTTHVRVGDQLYLHGSASNAMLRALARGLDACVAVTLLDGLVLARTAFHHSVNYRSVVLFGRAAEVVDLDEKRRVLGALVDKLEPGRSRACRPPNEKELLATLVVRLPIAEASAKVRSGPPVPDDGDDAQLPYWSGEIPLRLVREPAIPA
jgi:uncharacterized protein